MRSRALLLLTVMMTATLLMAASPAWATSFTVNSTADLPDRILGAEGCFTGRLVLGGGVALEQECTLRAAIQEANINSQSDSITFGSWLSGTTITLIQGQLTIADDNSTGPDLTVAGPGGSGLTVNGNNNSVVFAISGSAEATIDRITIRGGNADTGNGGGIINSFGTLTLTNSTVSDNTSGGAFGGGGINNGGTLMLTNSTVSDNKNTGVAHGGGIANYGTLTLTNSTVSGNTSRLAGGGIYSGGGTLTLTNSTVSGNTAGSFGGGIFKSSGVVAKLANTIVAGNADTNGHPDASGAFISQGHNLIGNTVGATGFGGSDLLNRNPLLGPLQNNGGPTSTHAIWPGSPAIDAADNTRCLFADQRGVARKDGDGNGSVVCDIGAYERSDFSSPKVVSPTTPAAGAIGVSRGANISAPFSEKMTRSTLNSATFKLFKVNSDGSTTAISSWSVRSTTDGLKATLNPFGTSSTLLAANTTYKALVTTGARDLAGNQLDQSPILAGKQQKAWTFTTGST